MKKVLIINKPTVYPKDLNHPCLMSLELDNPLSRVDAPAAILELEAGLNTLQSDRVRLHILQRHRGTLFRLACAESYVTILEGYNDYIRYDIVSLPDDEAWTLLREEGCEFVIRANDGDTLIEKDERTGYCKEIIRKKAGVK